jgi:hypothetical protein
MRLPPIEIVRGVVKVAVQHTQLGLRVLIVAALWGFVVPHATSWSWRLFFVSSVHELLSIPLNWELDRIHSDWVVGVILSTVVVVTFLGFTSLREYLIHLDDGDNMDLFLEAAERAAPVGDEGPDPPQAAAAQDHAADAEVEAAADAAAGAPAGVALQNAMPDAEGQDVLGDNHEEEVPLAVLIGLKVCVCLYRHAYNSFAYLRKLVDLWHVSHFTLDAMGIGCFAWRVVSLVRCVRQCAAQ